MFSCRRRLAHATTGQNRVVGADDADLAGGRSACAGRCSGGSASYGRGNSPGTRRASGYATAPGGPSTAGGGCSTRTDSAASEGGSARRAPEASKTAAAGPPEAGRSPRATTGDGKRCAERWRDVELSRPNAASGRKCADLSGICACLGPAWSCARDVRLSRRTRIGGQLVPIKRLSSSRSGGARHGQERALSVPATGDGPSDASSQHLRRVQSRDVMAGVLCLSEPADRRYV